MQMHVLSGLLRLVPRFPIYNNFCLQLCCSIFFSPSCLFSLTCPFLPSQSLPVSCYSFSSIQFAFTLQTSPFSCSINLPKIFLVLLSILQDPLTPQWSHSGPPIITVGWPARMTHWWMLRPFSDSFSPLSAYRSQLQQAHTSCSACSSLFTFGMRKSVYFSSMSFSHMFTYKSVPSDFSINFHLRNNKVWTEILKHISPTKCTFPNARAVWNYSDKLSVWELFC